VSAPFGDHPRFATYLVWAQRDADCAVQSILVPDHDGAPCSVTKITAPTGKWVIESMDQREFMTPTSIWRLDRRLGLKSPFFSVDPQPLREIDNPIAKP